MSGPAGAAIHAENLTKIYLGRHVALNSVDFTVDPGTILGVLGPNGAGKTTLAKLLLGLHVPTAGEVRVLGKRMTPNAAGLRQLMGYLPADPKFPEGVTPLDYLDYVAQLSGLTRSQRRARSGALLRAVDLLRVSGDRIGHFSTGMRTRLAIAASLINDPVVLVWDEPTHGLDPEARRTMLELMRGLAETKTLLLCTHQVSDIQEVCHRAIVLDEGQIVFHGAVEELRGTVKPSFLEILITGDKKEIPETVKSIQGLDELASATVHKNLMRLQIKESASHATALANVLVTLADHHLEIADLKVSGEQTEQAIAKLLSKREGSRGLSRAYQTADR